MHTNVGNRDRDRGAGRRFRPGVLPTLAVALLVPLFLALGNWQLDRAGQKRERMNQFQAAQSREPLRDVLATHDAAPAGYLHVHAEGEYAQGPQVLLEGRSHRGRPGYEVLTPLRPGNGAVLVMVNRGWIPRDYASAALPEVPPPATGTRQLEGVLTSLPAPGLRVRPDAVPDAREPAVAMLYPNATDLTVLFGEPVFDGMVLLSAEAAEGFVREWRPDGAAPMKHVGYAVQWFAFAGTLVLLYVLLNFRRPASGTGADRYGSGTT